MPTSKSCHSAHPKRAVSPPAQPGILQDGRKATAFRETKKGGGILLKIGLESTAPFDESYPTL